METLQASELGNEERATSAAAAAGSSKNQIVVASKSRMRHMLDVINFIFRVVMFNNSLQSIGAHRLVSKSKHAASAPVSMSDSGWTMHTTTSDVDEQSMDCEQTMDEPEMLLVDNHHEHKEKLMLTIDLGKKVFMDEHDEHDDIDIDTTTTDCPMAYDMMQHGIYYVVAKVVMPQMQVHSKQTINVAAAPPVINVVTERPAYSFKIAEKKQQLSEKFPIKSSKMISIVSEQQQQRQEKPQVVKSIELQEVKQEPVVINSYIAASQKVSEPTPQVKSNSQEIIKSIEQTKELSTPANSNDGFEIINLSSSSSSSSGSTNKRNAELGGAFGIAQGQRARQSFLAASNVARSLKLKESNNVNLGVNTSQPAVLKNMVLNGAT